MKKDFRNAVADYTVNLTAHAHSTVLETNALERDLLRFKNGSAMLVSGQESIRRAVIDSLVRRIVTGESKELNDSQIFMLTGDSPLDDESVNGLLQKLEETSRPILYIDNRKLSADENSRGFDIFKPFLVRGKLSLVFGVTPEEYYSTVKRDPAIFRRVPSILVGRHG